MCLSTPVVCLLLLCLSICFFNHPCALPPILSSSFPIPSILLLTLLLPHFPITLVHDAYALLKLSFLASRISRHLLVQKFVLNGMSYDLLVLKFNVWLGYSLWFQVFVMHQWIICWKISSVFAWQQFEITFAVPSIPVLEILDLFFTKCMNIWSNRMM